MYWLFEIVITQSAKVEFNMNIEFSNVSRWEVLKRVKRRFPEISMETVYSGFFHFPWKEMLIFMEKSVTFF